MAEHQLPIQIDNEKEANQGDMVHVPMDDVDWLWLLPFGDKVFMDQPIQKKSSSCSIQRVPDWLRQGDENAYMPQIVSIGSFYRGKESLQAVEEHKMKYLRDLIFFNQKNNRRSTTWGILEKYLGAVKAVEEKARGCYSENIHLDSKPFIEMMVVDGCFIISLLCKAAGLMKVEDGDPIFKMSWLMSKIQNDLLMLENQIPFVILQRLFDLVNVRDGHDRPSLAHLALNFFKELVPKIKKVTKEDPKINNEHLLHLFHSSLLPTVAKEDKQSKRMQASDANQLNLVHSAMALKEAGIKFKTVKEEVSLFDVKFKNGTMEIPTVTIHAATNSLFLNLVAFEQCYSDCSNDFTAYSIFMHCLIDSAKDVWTLRQSGVIENWLGSDDQVAHLFKMLCRQVAISTDGSYLSDVFRDVNQYCREDWNAWKASLKGDYFKNPWTILSVVAAVILLILTSIQTFYSMYAYYNPRS